MYFTIEDNLNNDEFLFENRKSSKLPSKLGRINIV